MLVNLKKNRFVYNHTQQSKQFEFTDILRTNFLNRSEIDSIDWKINAICHIIILNHW